MTDKMSPVGTISFTLLFYIVVSVLRIRVHSFLLDGPKVDCPHPALNCLEETYNRVIENLGCLGCQSGCQPGYIMTANPRYFATGNNMAGEYVYQGIKIPVSKNVSEPQWLCIKGDTCPLQYFHVKIDVLDSCAYCGDGCGTCESYGNCSDCLVGYRLTTNTIGSGEKTRSCDSSGVLCPEPVDGWHCKHQVYASATVGCSGCVICDDGYLPTSNPRYRRAPENVTGTYDYMGLRISGHIEITEARYLCEQGTTCRTGWHNVTRGVIVTCEADTAIVG